MKAPSEDDFRRIADALGLVIDDPDISAIAAVLAAPVEMIRELAERDAPQEPLRYPRRRYYVPSPDDNPQNAWAVRIEMETSASGRLSGKTVALKDTIGVAQVPMGHGSATHANFIPERDATVVTRILDQGGTIAGKANCEALSLGGGSHLCVNGPVHNPSRAGFSAGGSSSGCAALVAAGEVDLAVGGDQGGSIRMPAAFCGIIGLKPTFGLVLLISAES